MLNIIKLIESFLTLGLSFDNILLIILFILLCKAIRKAKRIFK